MLSDPHTMNKFQHIVKIILEVKVILRSLWTTYSTLENTIEHS